MAKPAFVLKYIKIATIIALPGCIDDKCINIYMAAISWLKDHPWFNHQIWRRFSECRYPDTFVTVSRIVCRCAHLTEEIEFSNKYKETMTIVVPLSFAFIIISMIANVTIQIIYLTKTTLYTLSL